MAYSGFESERWIGRIDPIYHEQAELFQTVREESEIVVLEQLAFSGLTGRVRVMRTGGPGERHHFLAPGSQPGTLGLVSADIHPDFQAALIETAVPRDELIGLMYQMIDNRVTNPPQGTA
jgi:hypothetical protein